MLKDIFVLGLAVAAHAVEEAHRFSHWEFFACGTNGKCQAEARTSVQPAPLHATDFEAQIVERGGRADPGWQVSGTATVPG